MTYRKAPDPGDVVLRDIAESDLPAFFEFQRDPEANYMAAFTAKDPEDREAFMTHWAKILADDGIVKKCVLVDGRLVGSILSHSWFGQPEVSYWIDKAEWGRGIATAALAALLELVETRPLYARAVKDNIASQRVLEKCGFMVVDEDKGFANGRGEEVEEYIWALEGPVRFVR